MLRFLLLALSLLMANPAHARQIALVMGNGAYQHVDRLDNATNDARDMADRLRGMGFDVYEGIDLNRSDSLRLVQDFARALNREDTALFFFAGHGVQLGADNYIMPVDVRPGTEVDLTNGAIRLQSILQSMENQADTRIVILDACRNNPFLRGSANRSGGAVRGLKRIEAGVGSYIAFSTEPGNVASDGNGRNSPFTAALLRHIATPGADIHAVMRKVRTDVMEASNRTQIPWENSALISEVFLASRSQPQSQTPVIQPQPPSLSQSPFSHRVQGLDPNGDGFLALREGITSGARRLAKMPEGTRLNVLQTQGNWAYVQTEFGMQGWAHLNWIAQTLPSPNARLTNLSCDQLWFQRNSYFARGGYCFSSARGRAAFASYPCTPGRAASDVYLSAQDRAEISAIKSQEQLLGCN
ncbi:MAG: caspase family protein [Pseudomonadota bacterium]